MKVTAVFDIGKTNKKFFLFDEKNQEVFKRYIRFDETLDEDGFACDDLEQIESWLKETLYEILRSEKFTVESINFSTYGASFVHLDKSGKPITPLYNYLKPIPDDVIELFYSRYGDPVRISTETASPKLDMLNSGLQLFWLKNSKPEIFEKIRWSLHFPQYVSYLFTGIPVSEFTSIGCHTALWDFSKQDYHDWVYSEGIDKVLPPVVDANTSINTILLDRRMKIGLGIHDSSAALVPYLKAAKGRFIVLSTGTWSIALNPFNDEPLTSEELNRDCLNYLRTDGRPVKASRVFLGNEHKIQVEKLIAYYDAPKKAQHQISYDQDVHLQLSDNDTYKFRLESINRGIEEPEYTDYNCFSDFKSAYHQLIMELIELQVKSIRLVLGKRPVSKLFIDGGFADNDIFVQMLVRALPELKIRTTKIPLGSALGAALVVSENRVGKKFLKKHYQMIKHSPILTK